MLNFRIFLKSNWPFRNLYSILNDQIIRDKFVKKELRKLKSSSLILDAGCGSQRYRLDCKHLIYKTQDFGQYKIDEKKRIGSEGVGGIGGYSYGKLDYVGDIWDVQELNEKFDAILCTEVFEHIPYPIETIKEFARLLKKDGTLILTTPSNCLRHMDPYFFYTGFSDRWFEKILRDNSFEVILIEPIGDYYSWLAVEIARIIMLKNIIIKTILLPTLIYLLLQKKTKLSTDTLCRGYHVIAKKI
jgi:SAM-dependent methyltransferase